MTTASSVQAEEEQGRSLAQPRVDRPTHRSGHGRVGADALPRCRLRLASVLRPSLGVDPEGCEGLRAPPNPDPSAIGAANDTAPRHDQRPHGADQA